jgi:hypothetical protein
LHLAAKVSSRLRFALEFSTCFTPSSEKIRQKGGILTTQDALKLAIEQDRDKIIDEAIVFRYKRTILGWE